MFKFKSLVLRLHAPEEVAIATKACANKIFLNSDFDSYSRKRRKTNIIKFKSGSTHWQRVGIKLQWQLKSAANVHVRTGRMFVCSLPHKRTSEPLFNSRNIVKADLFLKQRSGYGGWLDVCYYTHTLHECHYLTFFW